jgi:hypothetical protein
VATVRSLRILIGIACYGVKNLPFLKVVIARYREMGLNATIVVLSESPKDLGSDVEVKVGLPTNDPWSLPFAYKQLFFDRSDDFDLFIYSEDDIEVTVENLAAFVEASADLASDEIAGFVRYELCEDGSEILTDVHGAFHWDPNTAKVRGRYIIAELTNEHAGFFILTRQQLNHAIKSGGFMMGPRQGRYGIPETAATDPYTVCGFKKVICISNFDHFLIRHMSNLYVNRHGLRLKDCKEQIQTLIAISNGEWPASKLCQVEPKVFQRDWYKSYYEKPRSEIVELIPKGAESILCIGSGYDGVERLLSDKGFKITALPLDSVVGASLSRSGIEVINETLQEGFQKLAGRQFECLILTDLFHLLEEPEHVVSRVSRIIAPDGLFIISGPNFTFWKLLLKIMISPAYRMLRNYKQSGINLMSPSAVTRLLQKHHFTTAVVRYCDPAGGGVVDGTCVSRFLKQRWIIAARIKCD